jgi:hypothetical protein
MKKTVLLTILMALLAAVPALADNNQLEIADFSMAKDGQATVNITLSNPANAYNGLQFDLCLPQGISIATDANGSYTYALNKNRMGGGSWSANIKLVDKANNVYRFLVFNNKLANIKGNSGTLMTLTLKADANGAKGQLTGHLKNQKLVMGTTGVTKVNDVPFNVKLTKKAK